MDKLPKHWKNTIVDKVATKIHYGYTGKTIENGVCKYLRITDIQNSAVDWEHVPFVSIEDKDVEKYLLRENDIVFARTGATAGKSFLINSLNVNSVFASYLIRIIPDLEKIYPKFLYQYFQSPEYWGYILSNVEGAAQPNFNGKKLANIPIPLPPLSEQRLIVSKLDAVFERIDKSIFLLEENIKQTEHFMASVFHKTFENNCWKTELVTDFLTLYNGKAYKQQELLKSGSYKVIRIQNLNGGENFYYSNLELDSNKYCEMGDILYSWSGTPGSSFGAFIWNGEKAIYHYHIWKVELKKKYNRDFVLYALKYLTAIAIEQSHGGTGMMHITKGKMEQLEVKVPDIETQNMLANNLNNLIQKTDNILTEQKSKLQNLKALKRSISDKAFKGGL